MKEIDNFDWFKTFWHVAYYGSITKAADILGVVPSTVSKAIAMLEDEVGDKILVRTNRGIRLTKTGDKLYSIIYPSIEELMDVPAKMQERIPAEPRNLCVSASERMIQHFLVPYVIPVFSKQHSNIRVKCIDYTEGATADELLKNQSVSLAFVGTHFFFRQLNVVPTGLFENPNVCVMGANHKFLFDRPVSLEEFECAVEDMPFVFYRENKLSFFYYQDYFQQMGIAFEPSFEMPSIHAALSIVEAGVGYTFVPAICALNGLESGSLKVVHIRDLKLWSQREFLFRLKEAKLSNEAEIFEAMVIKKSMDISKRIESYL
ncbi:MAG: LysR family transcriptional regulator [Eubacterium sp.]|nr:LysR family transcriptional regulator [Eubacterium sp.]